MTGGASGPRALDLERLAAERVVAILRSDTCVHFRATVATLAESGVHLIECALTTPGALDAIRDLSTDLPAGVQLGAGTVTSPELVSRAVDAGATFLVTPTFSAAVLRAATDLGVPVLAGALTPTEVLAAWDAGATAVKIFPASAVGADYCRALAEPLPSVPLVPTGGVGFDNAADFLAAGAVALGVGGSLIGDAVRGGSTADLAHRCARLLEATRPENAVG